MLCQECDIPIHSASEHTQKHNRFLLTGVKLSLTSDFYSSSSQSPSDASLAGRGYPSVPNFNSQASNNKPVSAVHPSIVNPPPISTDAAGTSDDGVEVVTQSFSAEGNGCTSSISEYLQMLPGWRVDDFLDSSSTLFGFCKAGDDDMLPFWDADLESNLIGLSSENMRNWVPQASPLLQSAQFCPSSNMNTSLISGKIGFKDAKDGAGNNSTKYGRKNSSRDDSCFAVPQISPSAAVVSKSKRSRHFC